MESIFNLFRELSNGDEAALSAISILEAGGMPPKEAKKLAERVFFTIKPSGNFIKESFWTQASLRTVWKGLAGIEPENHTRWLNEQMSKKRHLAKLLRVPIYTLPLPRTGK